MSRKFEKPGDLYLAFLKAVQNDPQKAIALVGLAAFPDGPVSPPSPKAQALMDEGEWDVKEKVSMVAISRENCKGRVGTTSPPRFCYARNCVTIASHAAEKTKLTVEEGWYVRVGGRESQGAHLSPWLPPKAVPSALRIILTRAVNPLKMAIGMWRLLCEDYHDGESGDMSSSEGCPASGGDPLEVDTKPAAETRKPPPGAGSFFPEDAKQESVKDAGLPSTLTMQLLLTTATSAGDPTTSPFYAGFTDEKPFSEAFLQAGGEEARGSCSSSQPTNGLQAKMTFSRKRGRKQAGT